MRTLKSIWRCQRTAILIIFNNSISFRSFNRSFFACRENGNSSRPEAVITLQIIYLLVCCPPQSSCCVVSAIQHLWASNFSVPFCVKQAHCVPFHSTSPEAHIRYRLSFDLDSRVNLFLFSVSRQFSLSDFIWFALASVDSSFFFLLLSAAQLATDSSFSRLFFQISMQTMNGVTEQNTHTYLRLESMR